MGKRKADCTPEEWARVLEQEREGARDALGGDGRKPAVNVDWSADTFGRTHQSMAR